MGLLDEARRTAADSARARRDREQQQEVDRIHRLEDSLSRKYGVPVVHTGRVTLPKISYRRFGDAILVDSHWDRLQVDDVTLVQSLVGDGACLLATDPDYGDFPGAPVIFHNPHSDTPEDNKAAFVKAVASALNRNMEHPAHKTGSVCPTCGRSWTS